MTSDSLRRLASLAKTDDDVMNALLAAPTREAVVQIAAQHGIEIEASDLEPGADISDEELSDADLKSAVGGWHPKYSTFTEACM